MLHKKLAEKILASEISDLNENLKQSEIKKDKAVSELNRSEYRNQRYSEQLDSFSNVLGDPFRDEFLKSVYCDLGHKMGKEFAKHVVSFLEKEDFFSISSFDASPASYTDRVQDIRCVVSIPQFSIDENQRISSNKYR